MADDRKWVRLYQVLYPDRIKPPGRVVIDENRYDVCANLECNHTRAAHYSVSSNCEDPSCRCMGFVEPSSHLESERLERLEQQVGWLSAEVERLSLLHEGIWQRVEADG